MARIRIYIGRHLCTAPRAQKEADALAGGGHVVSVHGIAYRADFSARDKVLAARQPWTWEPAADYTSPSSKLSWFFTRMRHRLAREWFALTELITSNVWGYANHVLARHAFQNPADLTIVHTEGGIWFGAALQDAGYRVGVDFDDWFSHDLTAAEQRGRPVARLEILERRMLTKCIYASTTSHALADAMSTELGAPKPAVIYNTFPSGPEPVRDSNRDRATPIRLHWFSLVIGPNRGLETLFTALPAVHGSWELHLRGEVTPAYRATLLARVPGELHSRISFSPTIAAAELAKALATYDIGLALEVSEIPSRNLTITNKFFHYLQAGLVIVASDTAGHREGLALAPAAGDLFTAGQADALAATLNKWTTNPALLPPARHAARHAFVHHFAQELQAGLYLERAAAALTQSRS